MVVGTILTVVGTAAAILPLLKSCYYGVAIEIDNWFPDLNLVYGDLYNAEGTTYNPPKETIKAMTSNTGGAFGGGGGAFSTDWGKGSAGSVRYKISKKNKIYCMDIIWSQSSFEFKYPLRPSTANDWDWQPNWSVWSGYALLIGDDVCDDTVKAAYKKFKDYIYNINRKYESTKQVAEHNSYVWWTDGFIGGYEKRGLHRADVIRFPKAMIDIKVSMGNSEKTALVIEVGPKDYWTSDAYPKSPNNPHINDNYYPDTVYVYPNKTISFVLGILMISGLLFWVQILYRMVKYASNIYKSKYNKYESGKTVDDLSDNTDDEHIEAAAFL